MLKRARFNVYKVVFNHGSYIRWYFRTVGAHVSIEVGNLICLRHLFRTTVIANFTLKKQLYALIRAQRVLSFHLIKTMKHRKEGENMKNMHFVPV